MRERFFGVTSAAGAAALACLLGACSAAGGDDGAVTVLRLQAGECFTAGDATGSGEIDDIDTVPCPEPHDSEVFAVVDHPGGEAAPFPGDEEISTFAASECLARFESYVGGPQSGTGLSIGTIGPREESWDK
ncbi:MAG TPA: septum formation family protein, partial [Acidimicrobiia bacterium]|nr:septum formation family protein [Acidimicrobiia bacterium]